MKLEALEIKILLELSDFISGYKVFNSSLDKSNLLSVILLVSAETVPTLTINKINKNNIKLIYFLFKLIKFIIIKKNLLILI